MPSPGARAALRVHPAAAGAGGGARARATAGFPLSVDAFIAALQRRFPNGPDGGWMDMLTDFLSKTLTQPRGKALLAVWLLSTGTVFAIGGARAQEKARRRAMRKLAGGGGSTGKDASANSCAEGKDGAAVTVGEDAGKRSGPTKRRRRNVHLMRNLQYILRRAVPNPLCKETAHLTAYSALLVVRVYMTIKIAELTGGIGKFVGARQWDAIYKQQVDFGLICIPAAVATTLLKLEANQLTLSLRETLARYVHDRYYRVFYRASCVGHTLDTLDQRATADVAELAEKVTKLYGNVLKPTLEVALYSYRLSRMIGPAELSVFFLYFVASSSWLQLIMPPFGKLTAEQQRLEGELRGHHSRLLTHAEEIAFCGGGEREKELADTALKKISRQANVVHLLRSCVGVLDSYSVKYGGTMAAFSMMLPAVYLSNRKSTKGKNMVETTGYYLVATALFKALGDACKELYMSSYKGVSEVAGLTQRVYELMHHLEERGASGGPDREEERIRALCRAHERCTRVPPKVTMLEADPEVSGETPRVSMRHVDVFAPDGHLLVSDINIEVHQGASLIIEGPNGSGKSSLLRTLCGLWPLVSGEVMRPRPSAQTFLFVPQRPYLMPGTLRALLVYPEKEPKVPDAALDARLAEAMEQVGLSYLAPREGGWDAHRDDWIDVLSGGEKQRVAIARLLFHRPTFAALDEATSAVSADIEGKLVARLIAAGITLISVSHRPNLRRFHTRALTLEGDGGWKVRSI
eukprot:PRCOL_00003760-RA